MTLNPLLTREFRIPFKDIRAEHVEPGVRAILTRAQARIDALAADAEPRTWHNTIGLLDEITQEVSESVDPVHHLLNVDETPELREAYNAVLPEITRFWSALPLNPGLWRQVKVFAETPEAQGLTGIHARHLEKTLRDFRRAGADLPEEKKARLEEIRLDLISLAFRSGTRQRFLSTLDKLTSLWDRAIVVRSEEPEVLREAAEILSEPRLVESASEFQAIGDEWEKLAAWFQEASEAPDPAALMGECAAPLNALASLEEVGWQRLRDITSES